MTLLSKRTVSAEHVDGYKKPCGHDRTPVERILRSPEIDHIIFSKMEPRGVGGIIIISIII